MFNGQSLWDDGLDMGSLTGCPDACMLAIAEVSALGNWKAAEQRKASLSVPELIRRGLDIEQRLRQHFTEPQAFTSATLHPKIPQEGGLGASDDVRRLFARIFFESALLYLHTTLSGTNPSKPWLYLDAIQYLPPNQMLLKFNYPLNPSSSISANCRRLNTIVH
jgi:hypothetical protein